MVRKTVHFLHMIIFMFSIPLCADLSLSLELSDIHYLKDKHGKINPTAFEGDSFQLKTIVSGTDRATNEIEIDGLEPFTVQGQSHHSNISITNASILAEKTTEYTLIPKKKGTFTIGPATVDHNGKIYTSNSITIHVAQQTEKSLSRLATKPTAKKAHNGQSSQDYELFCTVKADKTSAVTEEPVMVTVSIYHRGAISQIRGLVPPKFSNCTVKEFEQTKEFKEKIKNNTFNVIQKQFLVYPTKPGTLNATPAQVIYTVPTKRRKNGSRFFEDAFFSDFFATHATQKVAASKPLSITIQKLPATKEKVDGIGVFSSFNASIDKTDVTVNEPIKLKLALTGSANFDLILAPELSLPKNFKQYDSKTVFKDDVKSFEFIVQIPQAGTWKIPAQTFHYFDTMKKKYRTLQTQALPITVTMPLGALAAPQLAEKQTDDTVPKPPTPITKDIHFIEQDVPVTKIPSRTLPLVTFLLLILFIPMLFYSKSIASVAYPFYARFFSFRKNILAHYQKQLATIVESNDFAKLYSLFTNFFANSCRMAISRINEDVISRMLKQKGLSQEKVDSFLLFLHKCAQYSFGATQDSFMLEEIQKRANYWLIVLHETLKK